MCFFDRFAYLEFATEDICTKNHKQLQNKKIRDKEIMVDFVGERSGYTKKEKDYHVAKEKDLKRLHIGGMDKTTSEADLKKLFPGCTLFTMPIKKETKLNMG